MGDAYWVRRILRDALMRETGYHPCPYCQGQQAIHSDGKTCGTPACKARAAREAPSDE